MLVAKQHIYAKKCHGNVPVFIDITTKIHGMYLDEKFIACKNKKYKKFNKIWRMYEQKIV